MISRFYRRISAFKLAPSPERALQLRARFDRIVNRRTGCTKLDKLLKRLRANKHEPPRALERPEIPLNTNYGSPLIPKLPFCYGPTSPKIEGLVLPRQRGNRTGSSPPQRLQLLRLWWKKGKRCGVMLPRGWLFPGRSHGDPISTR